MFGGNPSLIARPIVLRSITWFLYRLELLCIDGFVVITRFDLDSLLDIQGIVCVALVSLFLLSLFAQLFIQLLYLTLLLFNFLPLVLITQCFWQLRSHLVDRLLFAFQLVCDILDQRIIVQVTPSCVYAHLNITKNLGQIGWRRYFHFVP